MTTPSLPSAARRVLLPIAVGAVLVGSVSAVPASTVDTTPEAGRIAAAAVAADRKTITGNLDAPWDMAWLPGGAILVTQRDRGSIVMVRPNGSKKVVKKVKGVVSNGASGGEAGLLGIALHPRFARNHLVYVYMSSGHDNRIVRMKWRDGGLGAKHLVLKGIPRGLHHNGGHIAFGPDGMLYASTGEAGNASLAQNRKSLGGKMLRMTPNGSPAPGNPFRRSVVWSYGHRNVQGFDFDRSGRLWAVEFGDKKADELNLIRKGENYGWPVVEGRSNDSRFTNPKMTWDNEIAGPASVAIRRRVAWISGLTGHRVWRVRLAGRQATGRKDFWVEQYGRIRRTAIHGGDLYFTSSNTDGRAVPGDSDDRLVRVDFGR
jgi:glucose/arabinose dehydrogenase